MHIKQISIYLLAITSLLACRAAKPSVNGTAAQTAFSQNGAAWAALWQQQAAEYKALCFQAYNTAALRLDQYLQQGTAKPPAIVTDIDETVLDNSPFTVHTALQGQSYSDKAWQEWTARAACDTVPGALSFLRYAAGRGVEIFYITNRAVPEQAPTLRNLQRWGFPNADVRHLLLKTVTSGKEARRQQVLQTHDIVLLLGDNLSDFAAVFDKQPAAQRAAATEKNATAFGRRFIVLPNAMYGDWMGDVLKGRLNRD